LKLEFAPNIEKRGTADLLVVPFWEGGREGTDLGSLKKEVSLWLKSGDFKGKSGEIFCQHVATSTEPRILLLGLGKRESVDLEGLRRAYGNAVRFANGKKLKTVTFLFPSKIEKLSREEMVESSVEGILLANYAFSYVEGEARPSLLQKAFLIGVEKRETRWLYRLETLVAGVKFARDLVNGNADEVTPQKLAETAEALAKQTALLKATIFNQKKLEQEKMGLLLAVSRGSAVEPRLIQLAYRGNPKSKDHVVLVGKGVTYDTGGLSLKPTDGMLTMKCDMSGAAAVLGAVYTAAALGLKVNVTALAPAAENGIDAKSYKLGDVYRSYNGKTVEITNTDAEGRLILADALGFAVSELKPTCMIDLATLTGAMVVAVGEEISGFFTKEETLAKELLEASQKTGELLWRMPLYDDYKDALKSDIADMINSAGRDGSAIKAALFLREFVGNIPWAHIDIAGPAFLSKPKHYNPVKGTGYGVRLLVEFLERRAASQ
jgi:leucyl aminopeptidase